MTGELTLRIDSDGASIRIFYSKLLPRFDDCKSTQDEGEDAVCTLKVDTKKLSSCLQWQATMTKTVSSGLMCMVENEMLVLHVMLNPASVGFFTYYVPVHYLSSSQMD
jgi:HUS1 checkpoint protein